MSFKQARLAFTRQNTGSVLYFARIDVRPYSPDNKPGSWLKFGITRRASIDGRINAHVSARGGKPRARCVHVITATGGDHAVIRCIETMLSRSMESVPQLTQDSREWASFSPETSEEGFRRIVERLMHKAHDLSVARVAKCFAELETVANAQLSLSSLLGVESQNDRVLIEAGYEPALMSNEEQK